MGAQGYQGAIPGVGVQLLKPSLGLGIFGQMLVVVQGPVNLFGHGVGLYSGVFHAEGVLLSIVSRKQGIEGRTQPQLQYFHRCTRVRCTPRRQALLDKHVLALLHRTMVAVVGLV